jgi:hypothetical protein
MSTQILKYDVGFQKFLIGLNLLFLILGLAVNKGFFLYILGMQFIGGAAQLTGSGMHLMLQHKSIGFSFWRKVHFTGSVIYMVLLGLLTKTDVDGALWFIAVFAIPQCIFYAYFFLCFKELKFLENREFHMLR